MPLNDRHKKQISELVKIISPHMHSGINIMIRHKFYTLVGIAFIFSFFLLWCEDSLESLPVTLFATITAIFSYNSYKASNDKFRLDLFEKRFAIYQKTVEFCSYFPQVGTLTIRPGDGDENKKSNQEVQDVIDAAENSFRGIAWHTTQMLFGDDIYDLFSKLNDAYSQLRGHSMHQSHYSSEEFCESVDKKYQNAEVIASILRQLPEKFKPYIYFGDYKKD